MMKSSVIALLLGATVAGDCYDGDGAIIADCKCHETCGDCGRWSNPVYEDDCIDCQDGFTHTPVYSDGTGMCLMKDATMDWDMEEFDYDMEEEMKWDEDYSMDYSMDYNYDYSWDSSNSTMMNSTTEWDYPEWEDDYFYTMEDFPEYEDEWYGYDSEWDYYYYMDDYGYDYYDYGYYDYDYGEYYPDYYYSGDVYYSDSGSWMDDV